MKFERPNASVLDIVYKMKSKDTKHLYAMARVTLEGAVNYQELVRAEKWAQQQFERLTQMFIEAGKAGEEEQCQQQ